MQEIDSEQVLKGMQRVKVQRAQKRPLDDMKSIKDFDHMQKGKQSKIADKR